MSESKLKFSRNQPLRGPDGPTPDYVPPETGSFKTRAKIFGGLAAVSIGIMFAVAYFMEPFATPDRQGLGLASPSGLPVLSITDSPDCALEVLARLENLENRVLTTSGTSVAFRKRSESGYEWPPITGQIPAVEIEPGAIEIVIMTFQPSECVSDPQALSPKNWSVSFKRPDGTSDYSNLQITNS